MELHSHLKFKENIKSDHFLKNIFLTFYSKKIMKSFYDSIEMKNIKAEIFIITFFKNFKYRAILKQIDCFQFNYIIALLNILKEIKQNLINQTINLNCNWK